MPEDRDRAHETLEEEIEGVSRDLAIGFHGVQTLIGQLERRIAGLEAHRDIAIANHAAHDALLTERRRDGEASREYSRDLAKHEALLDELRGLGPQFAKLEQRIATLEVGGDAAQIKKAKNLGLSGAGVGVASFIATIIVLVVQGLMKGGN